MHLATSGLQNQHADARPGHPHPGYLAACRINFFVGLYRFPDLLVYAIPWDACLLASCCEYPNAGPLKTKTSSIVCANALSVRRGKLYMCIGLRALHNHRKGLGRACYGRQTLHVNRRPWSFVWSINVHRLDKKYAHACRLGAQQRPAHTMFPSSTKSHRCSSRSKKLLDAPPHAHAARKPCYCYTAYPLSVGVVRSREARFALPHG
ncbi:hypothetical protein ACQKWADRAFT_291510 [Trichoderma austrokoningii]